MSAVTLTEFLPARFDEDERREWRTCTDCGCSGARCDSYGAEGRKCCPDCRHPARVLAEVEAKRRIVELIEQASGWYAPVEGLDGGEVLRLLAMPYADHPDYRQEWKP